MDVVKSGLEWKVVSGFCILLTMGKLDILFLKSLLLFACVPETEYEKTLAHSVFL